MRRLKGPLIRWVSTAVTAQDMNDEMTSMGMSQYLKVEMRKDLPVSLNAQDEGG